MYVLRINNSSSYSVARKIIKIKHRTNQAKTLCMTACNRVPAKKMVPGLMLLAESIFMPLNQPSNTKIARELLGNIQRTVHNKVAFPELIKETGVQAKVKSMVDAVLPYSSKEFIDGIVQASDAAKCSAEDLTALMYVESRFNPKASNGAFVGLGQMNKRSLKLSVDFAKRNKKHSQGIDEKISMDIFKSLTREEQLPYVRNYILGMKEVYFKDVQRSLNGGELYGLFYTPGRINAKYLSSGSDPKTAEFYKRNKGLDFNKDGVITKDDLQNVLENVKQNVLVSK